MQIIRFGATPTVERHIVEDGALQLDVDGTTDRKPPLIAGENGYSTSVHGSLLQGRTWTLELTRQF